MTIMMKKAVSWTLATLMALTVGSGIVHAEEPVSTVPAIEESRPELSDGVRAKLEEAKAQREQLKELRSQIHAQHEANKDLFQQIRGHAFGEKREALQAKRALMQEKRESLREIHEQMKAVHEALREAIRSGDKEKVAELREELAELKQELKEARAEIRAEQQELKDEIEEFKAEVEALKEHFGGARELIKEGRALVEELKALREQRHDAVARAREAWEVRDEEALSAALDEVMAIQAEMIVKAGHLLEIQQQIHELLSSYEG